MSKNYAIAIGINQYQFLQPLDYASNDAWLVQKLFREDLGFERVFVFTDTTKQGIIPTRANLLNFIAHLSMEPFLEPTDNFWFFFRGHGINHNGSNYLMPVDGQLTDIDNTAISIAEITNYLNKCGAGNTILLLDIFYQERKTDSPLEYLNYAKLTNHNITTFFAQSYSQLSYDIPFLKYGVFAYALTEGLGDRGQCSTVAKLDNYLHHRVYHLVQQYHQADQTPALISPQANRILIGKHATKQDINTLKNSALQAETKGELETAKNLWIQVLAVVATDTDGIDALQRIYINQCYSTSNFKQSSHQPSLVNHLGQNQAEISTTDYSTVAVANPTTQHSNSHIVKPSPQQTTTDIISKQKTASHIEIEQFVTYEQLATFLSAQNWREADKATSKLLLEISGRQKEGWLTIAAINKLNPHTLQLIDKIWHQHSQGRFGFSVQKQIWETIEGSQNANYHVWCDYCDRLGWRVNDNWCFYSSLTFDITAPKGHFPAAGIINIINPWKGWSVGAFACVNGFINLIYSSSQMVEVQSSGF